MYCTKCEKEFDTNEPLCPECGSVLVRKGDDEHENRIPVASEAPDLAAQLKGFFEYSGIQNVYEEYDKDSDTTRLLVDESRYREAVKLLAVYNREQEKSLEEPDPEAEAAKQEDDVRQQLLNHDTRVYVPKAARAADLESSGQSLVLVGIICLVADVCLFLDILPMKFNDVTKILMELIFTVMGLGFFIYGIVSLKNAKGMKGQVSAEENLNKEITAWFLNTYTTKDLDGDIDDSLEAGETISLTDRQFRRMELIKTNIHAEYDLSDESYVDMLCEEIYVKLYESEEE